MAIDTTTSVDVATLTPFKKFIMTIGALPTSYLESMTYAELLMWFCNYLQETVIPTVNNNAEAVEELQGLYEELRTYVNNYFDNLDVQEEINNKLDELVEDGTLTSLIGVYINDDIMPLINQQNTTISQQNDRISDNLNAINTLSSRMDTFTQLTDGSTSGDAELADIRTGFNGTIYDTAGDAVRSEDNILFNRVRNIEKNTIRNNIFDNALKQGLYSASDGTFDSSRTDYVSSINKIDLTNIFMYKWVDFPINNFYIYILWYAEDDTFISSTHFVNEAGVTQYQTPPQNASYCRLSIHTPTNTAITPSDIPYLTLYGTNINNNLLDIINTSLYIRNISLFNFQNIIYTQGSGTINYSNIRIGHIFPTKLNKKTKISTKTGYSYSYVKWNTTNLSKTPATNASNELAHGGWLSTETIFNAGDIITLNIRKNDNTAITPSEAINLIVEDYEETSIGSNYSIDSALAKKTAVLEYQGKLTYPQSFLIYNNKYYSTDGEHIAVQNSSFVQQSTVDVSCGHGNNFQLGHNGKAYISGWNDQKIYIIDLETLTVDNTITLPTNGYTTCAVDDINKIAYIFFRSSYPDSETSYDFIAYDYQNHQELYSKKTEAFGGMQACDFVDGKIIVISGLGTNVVPNYYKVYNTNGDVIGEYKLGQFASNEPEGVFVDRNNKTLYISIYNAEQQDVYKIS